MIEIRATESEVEVSGTVDELLEIALSMRAFRGSSEELVTVPAAPCTPAPYQESLAELVVALAAGRTYVSISHGRLEVSGSASSLEAFSSWFEFPAGSTSGRHNHFEPLPHDPYHSSASASLVVMVR